jgi:hypothetical protein
LIPGNNVFLDLDVLVLKDLKPYFDEYGFSEGRFVKNHWMDHDYVEMNCLEGTNYVNSSIVTWKDDQLDWIRKFYLENREVVEFKYGDLDTFLFQALRKNLRYHPDHLAYSFNARRVAGRDYSVALFNTSQGRGLELHEVSGPMKELWVSYDVVD